MREARALSERMHYERICEPDVDQELRTGISDLLQAAFEGYPPNRSHYKQLPSFRILGFDRERLAAHCAVDYRMVSVNNRSMAVFGLSDLCVQDAARGKGAGSGLIGAVHEVAVSAQVDWLLAFSASDEFYAKNGFQPLDVTCRWMLLQGERSWGLLQRRMPDILFVRRVSARGDWPPGILDLMGPVF